FKDFYYFLSFSLYYIKNTEVIQITLRQFLKREIIFKILLFSFSAYILLMIFSVSNYIEFQETRKNSLINLFEHSVMTFEDSINSIENDFNNVLKDFYENFESDGFFNTEINKKVQTKNSLTIDEDITKLTRFDFTVYLTNKDGIIKESFNSENYSLKINNPKIIEVIKNLGDDIYISNFLIDINENKLVKFLVSHYGDDYAVIKLNLPNKLIFDTFNRLALSVSDEGSMKNVSSFIMDSDMNTYTITGKPLNYSEEQMENLNSKKISYFNISFLRESVNYSYTLYDHMFRPVKFFISFEVDKSKVFSTMLLYFIIFICFLILTLYIVKRILDRTEKYVVAPINHIVEKSKNFDLKNPDSNSLEYKTTSYKLKEINFLDNKLNDFSKYIIEYFVQLKGSYNDLENAFATIEEKNDALKDAYLNFAQKLSVIAEGHDEVTGKHIYRVGEISAFFAEKLGMSREETENIRNFAPLHDIGKIFTPNEILKKDGPLTPEEWTEMKNHTVNAAKILDDDYFITAKNIALYHHEKYDGSGYPYGISGNDIPIEAQIVQMADIFDALRSQRPYKKSFSLEETYDIILKGDSRLKPNHFNPDILDIFKYYYKKIDEIFLSLQD
ncbi:MAG TPA: HD-GYP domain-containing protein, partial [Tepiditoga sp.]|nr:HD-GYP domain-containing protein [Tepiditoga sp.]